MNRKIGSRGRTEVDSIKQFRTLISNELNKLKNELLTQSVLEELKEVLRTHVTNAEKMNILINVYIEKIYHIPMPQRKEFLKLLITLGETFESALSPFIPKILSLTQRLAEEPQLHIPLSNSLGTMIHHVFKTLTNHSTKVTQLSSIISHFFVLFKNPSHNTQTLTGMCLTRIIQNSPADALSAILDGLTDCLLGLLRNPLVKCATQVLEALISLVLAVEYEFEPYAKRFVPVLIEEMERGKEWTVRKMAIDVVYTFAAFLPRAIEDEVGNLVAALKECKADKVKHVREAAQEALVKINEVKKELNMSSHSSPNSKPPEIPKHLNESKSIFKGPSNPNFFKAAPKS
eukprot:TRINITY_DN12118_c0_g2_i2.p1 TRINITY_DN12118_c0_g2~~TRINITY_DN12118_c0_g2_i2.p1  ORF type:complete len:381 (+),score=74.94 TRINITY_DN12118_c0_g2_i2:107-1144(+)